jgi:hypothetical protein
VMSSSTDASDVECLTFSELSFRLQQFTNMFTDMGMVMDSDDEQTPLRETVCAQLQELLSILGDSGDDAVDGSSSEQDVVSTHEDNVSVHIGLFHSTPFKCLLGAYRHREKTRSHS